MNSFQIRIIAITAMVIDHIGLYFFPNVFWLRVIGRFAFPLFAWLIANGMYYTKNVKSYLSRLLVFAFISQIPFLLINWTINPRLWQLNVLFTLFLGLIAIFWVKKNDNTLLQFFSIGVCVLAAHLLQTDYAGSGILSIVTFYFFFHNFKKLVLSQLVIYFVSVLFYILTHTQLHLFYLIEPIGLFSLIFIYFYNHKSGSKFKYLFYWFYPLHLLVLYFIKVFLNRL